MKKWLIGYLMAVAGVAALGSRATAAPKPTISVSSIYNAEYAARFAVDGNPLTRWASESNDQGDLILDFGKVYDVNQIAIAWENAYAAEYKIDIAGEDKRWKTVRHKKNGRGGTDTFKELKSKARYMRIQCMRYGPYSLWSIWEIKFDNPKISAALKQAAEVRHKKKKRVSQRSGFSAYSIGARTPQHTVAAPSMNSPVWEIGTLNRKSGEFALAPDKYEDFLKHDFGWENRFYLIGHHSAKKDFPYALPGASSTWGGTWGTSGWRTHVLNILFGLEDRPNDAKWVLRVVLTGNDPAADTLFKVTVNGHSWKEYIPKGKGSLKSPDNQQLRVMEFPVDPDLLRRGGNEVNLTILRGSWVTFDQVSLHCSETVALTKPEKAFVRNVEPAGYELKSEDDRKSQPLLVHVEHLKGAPKLSVLLDGKQIFASVLEEGNTIFEAPMPAVSKARTSSFEIRLDGKKVRSGTVERVPAPLQTPADYVDTRMGTGHSRWMIAPGPWMPFSMVKLSPDNQNGGWQAGYEPSIENIGTFSHVHEWTLGGLGMMPTAGELEIVMGSEHRPEDGYRSEIDKGSEKAGLGHYEVLLSDHAIKAELTATTRCGFQRYTFSGNDPSRVMIDLKIPAENNYRILGVEIKQVNDQRIEGFSHQIASAWGGCQQEYRIHFVIEFDRPITKFGIWENDTVHAVEFLRRGATNAVGAFAEFDTSEDSVVQARSALSFVSIENAALNLETEIAKPFGWSFEAVKDHNRQTWNDLLGRLKISTNDRGERYASTAICIVHWPVAIFSVM